MKKLRMIALTLTATSLVACHNPNFFGEHEQFSAGLPSESSLNPNAQELDSPMLSGAEAADTPQAKASLAKVGSAFNVLSITDTHLILSAQKSGQSPQAFVLSLSDDLPSSGLLELDQLAVQGQAMASTPLQSQDGKAYTMAMFGSGQNAQNLAFRIQGPQQSTEDIWLFLLTPVDQGIYRVQAVTEADAFAELEQEYQAYVQRYQEKIDEVNEKIARLKKRF